MEHFDFIIGNGTVFDGTGGSRFQADIGIKGDIVAKIGNLSADRAGKRIDAGGLWVTPGFIDAHTHTDTGYSLLYPGACGKITQGVTTDVAGLCGGSAAPRGEGHIEESRSRAKGAVSEEIAPISVREYAGMIETTGNSTNIALHVGNSNLRIHGVGYENRRANAAEMASMKALLKSAMEEGAFGLSTGLTYVPSQYADTDELVELCKIIAPYGGIYNSHMRNESDFVMDSIREVIEIAEKSGCHGHISHLKISGIKNHGKAAEALKLIEDANNRGIPITYDVYAYTAGSISLSALLPPWVLSEGFGNDFAVFKDPEKKRRIQADLEKDDWENIILSVGYANIAIGAAGGIPAYEGKSISEIAGSLNISELDALFKVLKDSGGHATIIQHSLNEKDLEEFIVSPYCTIGTDAFSRNFDGPTAMGKPHPRNYGGFPRFLRRYVLNKRLVSPERAVHMITGFPAEIFHVKDRGLLKAGMKADITIFNPDTITDTGDYGNPAQPPKGIEYVFVNGRMALDGGKFQDIKAGKVLFMNRA